MTRTDLPTSTDEIYLASDTDQTVYEKVDITESARPLPNNDVSLIVGCIESWAYLIAIPSVSARWP